MANRIEIAIAVAEAETGVRGGQRSIPLCFAPSTKQRSRIWTKGEEEFVSNNHGRISEIQIARHLGRSPEGVELHIKREMHLVSMSKDPAILTAEQVANGLGLDSKSVHLLMDTGRMPCRRLPILKTMRVIDRLVFIKWMLNPENWLYFKQDRVGTLSRKGKRGPGENYDFAFWESARGILLKARRKWKDSWMTPGQVVKYLKINPKATMRRKASDKMPGVRYVNMAIRKGTIKAKRWGNWWIKKSDLPGRGKTINFKGLVVEAK